jgi:hypothetical protein
MQYMLLLYFEEAGWFDKTADEQKHWLGAYESYREALTNAGVLKGSSPLASSKETTNVRIESGRTQVLDGPYIESKEQLGGYYIVEVPDLDAAIAWAARCPCTMHGAVEVRALGRRFDVEPDQKAGEN